MGKKKILVFDDDININSFVCEALNRAGFETLDAYDGYHCLELLTDYKPDLIILDINMPGPSGLEICERISKFSNVPIFFLSSQKDKKTLNKVFTSNAIFYLNKPLKVAELLKKIEIIFSDQL